MSKLTPLQILERHYNKYIEYENAFNNDPFDETKIQQELVKAAKSSSNFDSEEFKETVIDLMIEKPARRSDVNNAALRFYLYTEFFLLTQEEDVPDYIMKDFNSLPIKETMKPFFSIKEGKFIRNEDTPIKVERDKLKALYEALNNQSV